MKIQEQRILQDLLAKWTSGTIATTKWLAENKVSRMLANSYKKSGWISSFGHGAFFRPHEKIEWPGALHALQDQLDLKIHVGGKTALEQHGFSHYIAIGQNTIDLLKMPSTNIPKWFLSHNWQEKVRITECSILPPAMGIEDMLIGNINIKLSCRERAAIELVYLAPRLYSFDEIPLILESLGSLRGDVINELLLNCSSEKAKRLMLYFGEVQKHPWYKKIDQTKLKIGSTTLKIASNNGKYIPKYNISIPKDYDVKDESEIKF